MAESSPSDVEAVRASAVYRNWPGPGRSGTTKPSLPATETTNSTQLTDVEQARSSSVYKNWVF